jgi:predicted nucleotidyltransferase
MITKDQKRIIYQILAPLEPIQIWIFGSYARGENKKGSDMDLMIKVKKHINLLDLIGVEQELSDALGVKVDLVTEGSLDPLVKPYVDLDIKPLYVNEE